MKFKTISIVMPVFNEAGTLAEIIKRVMKVKLPLTKELILIDDGSTDGSREILMRQRSSRRVIFLERNFGKGYAVRRGFETASGDLVIVQDADLEYDPGDYLLLVEPILSGRADVVFGSRFVSNRPRRVLYFDHYMANRFLTFVSNMLTGLNLSDMETGYKVFSRKAIETIRSHLTSDRFGIEAELTAEAARHKFRVFEVGISYSGRTYEEGKKINWRDGLAAIWHVIRFNLFRNCPRN